MSASRSGATDGSDTERYHASRRVTWASVALNSTLSVAQVVIGVLGGSQALVADGVHTLSDLITDGLVLFALKHSAKGADEEHPYGHGRIETAVTLILGGSLVVVALGLAWRAGDRLLFDPAPFVAPSTLTFWAALVTLAAKEGLYRYTMRTASRFASAMLTANAWHHRSDAISSLAVVIGVGGAIYGFAYLDAVAAVVVSVLIARIGVVLGWQALRELIDTGLDPEPREEIRHIIAQVAGVRALHLLRTRRAGSRVLIDVHILVDPHLSVSEGHHIGEAVRGRLIEHIPAVADVMVHVDTEDDGISGAAEQQLTRGEVARRLNACFADIPEAQSIERMLLHYGRGRVDVEVRLPLAASATAEDARALTERMVRAAARDPEIGKLDVLFRCLPQHGS